MCKEFLASKPKKDAYEDFAYWDSVIENGFGGHNFATFGNGTWKLHSRRLGQIKGKQEA